MCSENIEAIVAALARDEAINAAYTVYIEARDAARTEYHRARDAAIAAHPTEPK